MLNSIGLDNDGIDAFVAHHLPYLASAGSPVIVSIAGRTLDEFVSMAARLGECEAWRCGTQYLVPQRLRRCRFGTDPDSCHNVVSRVVAACGVPVIAKLTPNVTSIARRREGSGRWAAPTPFRSSTHCLAWRSTGANASRYLVTSWAASAASD